MKISIDILIATMNRPNLLTRCLRSIGENQRPPSTVFVIDQSEDDASKKVVDEFTSNFEIRYIHRKTPGKALALNAALKESNADFIALTDDDCELSSDWLEKAFETITLYAKYDAFCGQVLPEPDTNPDDYLNLVLNDTATEIKPRHSPLSYSFCGANLLIRRQAIIDAGCFNPLFGPGGKFYCDIDGELAYRLLRNGAKLLYHPDLKVYHSNWRRTDDNQRLRYRYAFGLGAFAGYYLSQSHLVPFYFWSRKMAVKTLKTLIFTVSGRKTDANVEKTLLKGLWNGFFAGLNTPRKG